MNGPNNIQFAVDGLSQESLDLFFQIYRDASGLEEAPSIIPKNNPPEPICLVCDELPQAGFGDYGHQAVSAVCELAALDSLILSQINKTILDGGMALSITTRSAFNDGLGNAVCDWVAKGFSLPGAPWVSLKTAVQEAIANAVLHGNLEIGTELRDNLKTLDDFTNQVSMRLSDSQFGCRSISIFATLDDDQLRIRVLDQGSGMSPDVFVNSGQRKNIQQMNAPSGRGLHIIRNCTESVTLGASGRELEMVFDY